MADVDDLPDTDDDDSDDDQTDERDAPEPTKPVPGQRDPKGEKPEPKPEPGGVDLKDAALRKANREAGDRRREITRLQKELDDLKTANASEQEKALIKARQEALTEAETRWRPQVIAMRADAALTKAGCTDPDDRELLLNRIDAAQVELDEQGGVVGGLDDQVASLKERYAKMFASTRTPRVPSAREVDAGDKRPPAVKKSATQRQVEQLMGR